MSTLHRPFLFTPPINFLFFLFIFALQDAYNNVPREVKVTHLLATIHNGHQSEEARQMAAVLLRRLFSSEFLEFYKEVSEQLLSFIVHFDSFLSNSPSPT